MDRSYWAGVTIAETANQLALSGLFVAAFFHGGEPRARERHWLALTAGSLSCAAVSLSVALATANATTRGGTSELFAVGTVGLLLAVIVTPTAAVGDVSRRVVRVPLSWLFPVVLVIAGAFFAVWPAVRAPSAQLGVAGGQVVLSNAGRILAAAVGLGLVAFAARRWRVDVHLRAQAPYTSLGALGISLLLLLDASGSLAGLSQVPLATHVGFPWAILQGIVHVQRRQHLLTQRRLDVEELAYCRAEVEENHSVVERLKRELGTKKQLAAVGELAAAIAHEVRNPLAIIMNAAAGLRRPTLQSEDRSTLLSILDEETARLNRLVTDLLRFARPVIIKRSSVSILELIKRVQGRLEDSAILDVSIPEEESLRVVQADTNLLRLVFENLVANAFQAMPDGGTVRIVVTGELLGAVPHVRIDIIDHGHGMDEQVLSRATDPFYTTRPSGTGLGLPIVQRIVEAHGGRIDINSAPSQGTKVSLFLPQLEPTELHDGLSPLA